MRARPSNAEEKKSLEQEMVRLFTQLTAVNKKYQTVDAQASASRAIIEAQIASCRRELSPFRPDIDEFEAKQRERMAKQVAAAHTARAKISSPVVATATQVKEEGEVINPYLSATSVSPTLSAKNNPSQLSTEQRTELVRRVHELLEEYTKSYSRHSERVLALLTEWDGSVENSYRLLRKERYPEVEDYGLLISAGSKLRSTPNKSFFASTLGMFLSDAYPGLLDKCLAIYSEPKFACDEMTTLINAYPFCSIRKR